MELYINNDGSIAKYVHDDGSETAIKTWPEGMESCGGSGRKKFNVFASCSSGCWINCKFCFLTSKKFEYNPIHSTDIANNVIEAISSEIKRRPELKEIPFNLSFMGMGEPWYILDDIYLATKLILEEISPKVKYIEGVDIATTLPSLRYDDVNNLRKINKLLENTGKLTDKPESRSNVRVFYSLHSGNDKTRRKLIPKTLDIDIATLFLTSILNEFNVIYHYILLDGINDNLYEDIVQIASLFRYKLPENSQLRILRYNKCPNSKFEESKDFDKMVEFLNKWVYDLKVQLSPGSEISAACGMFLMKNKEVK